MALRVFDPTDQKNKRERVIVYGRSGIGKTRFALSLTPRFGDILYYPADPNSEFLDSIPEHKQKRVHVLLPEGDDPILNFQEFCIRDWRSEYPTVKTIVVDTYTQVAKDAVAYSANTMSVTAEKHFKVGDPATGGQVIPNRGDYQAVESISRGFFSKLFRHQKDYHIVLVFHEESKIIGGKDSPFPPYKYGGPAHPGWGMTEDLPGLVSTVIRLKRDPVQVPGKPLPEVRVVAITAHDGEFVAKLRESDEVAGNPMPKVICDLDPTNFWVKYDTFFAPTNAAPHAIQS